MKFSMVVAVCVFSLFSMSHGMLDFDEYGNSTNITTASTAKPTTTKTLSTTKTPSTLPTPVPPTKTPVFVLTDKHTNITCLKLRANITFSADKPKLNGMVPWYASIDGSCTNISDTLILSWHTKNTDYDLTMKFEKKSSDYSLKHVVFEHDFNNTKTPDQFQSNSTNFTSGLGTYYSCDTAVNLAVQGLNLTFDGLKVAAFMDKSPANADFGSPGKKCPAPPKSKVDAIVPIAVGAALAAMVLIVLVGYCIGRRRQSAGYQQMNA